MRTSGNDLPPATAQRSRANSPNAVATSPSISMVMSCHGLCGLPLGKTRLGSSSRCCGVSHRPQARSIPPHTAMLSSTTTIFWWWLQPAGCAPSKRKRMARVAAQRTNVHALVGIKNCFKAPKRHLRMAIWRCRSFRASLRKKVESRYRRERSPGSSAKRVSKSQPMNSSRFCASSHSSRTKWK